MAWPLAEVRLRICIYRGASRAAFACSAGTASYIILQQDSAYRNALTDTRTTFKLLVHRGYDAQDVLIFVQVQSDMCGLTFWLGSLNRR